MTPAFTGLCFLGGLCREFHLVLESPRLFDFASDTDIVLPDERQP